MSEDRLGLSSVQERQHCIKVYGVLIVFRIVHVSSCAVDAALIGCIYETSLSIFFEPLDFRGKEGKRTRTLVQSCRQDSAHASYQSVYRARYE